MDMEQAEQLYRLMFTNMREGLAILHLDVRNPDAPPLIIEMNPAAVKLCRCRSFNFGNCLVTDCFGGWFDADLLKETCHRRTVLRANSCRIRQTLLARLQVLHLELPVIGKHEFRR